MSYKTDAELWAVKRIQDAVDRMIDKMLDVYFGETVPGMTSPEESAGRLTNGLNNLAEARAHLLDVINQNGSGAKPEQR